jgi:glycosyltransferase involved in cell wall biosynthesis
MHIGFDAEVFCRQRSGGISLHFSSLIKELILLGHRVTIYCLDRRRHDLDRNTFASDLLLLSHLSVKYYQSIFDLRRCCHTDAIDIFHCTYYSFRPRLIGIPVVRTFHDAALIRFPGSLLTLNSLARLFLQSVSFCTCDGLVLVSHFSFHEYSYTFAKLRHLLCLPDIPFSIIPNASSIMCSSLEPVTPRSLVSVIDSPPCRPKVKVLYVGLRSGYKNFSNGLKAIAIVADRLRVSSQPVLFHLSLVSQEPLTSSEARILRQANITIDFLSNIDECALSTLYRTSDFLLHSSIYEGFGITVLEAMRLGCPVLAVDNPAVREVAGDTIWYSDGGKPEDISLALYSLLSTNVDLSSKRTSALSRSHLFSWSKSALLLERFYASLISSI